MAVTRLEITSRQAYAGGRVFGDVGEYEQLDGAVHFAVDPFHPDNGLIADIDLAPRNGDGLVEFSAGFRILRPVAAEKSSRTLFLDVVNRGRGRALKLLNDADDDADPGASPEAGNGFLMRRGYTIVWCGWQHDVPDGAGLLRIDVPQAMTQDGPVSGRMALTFQPNADTAIQMLSERGHQPYPTNNPEDWNATLTVRDHEEAEPEAIPRERWHFARLENGRRIPDPSYVHLETGFEAGRIYQVIYSTSKAPVAGLGLLATRDVISFLRYAGAGDGNPCAGEIDYSLGFGQSQSGRFLRHLVYLGLNVDETGRQVFDGLIAHVAGPRRGEFNQRFAQPSTAAKQSMSNSFPFTASEQTDPETGRADGLLSRQEKKGGVPKMFLMNSGAEYWWAHLSLAHTDVDGKADVELPENVRLYYYAGTQHASGNFPPIDRDAGSGSRGEQLFNWVDYRPVLRASLANLERWVQEGETPPASRHPRLDDGTLTPPENIRGSFTAIPGVGFPAHYKRISRMEFNAAESDAANLPSWMGNPYPMLVPAVDQDGNELGGIRLPDIAAPLATHTGWNLRHRDNGGAGQVIGTTGATIPFPATREDREAAGDPRLSVEERYGSREEYLARVREAAQGLLDDGFRLAEDIAVVEGHAGERYDAVMETARQPQPADN